MSKPPPKSRWTLPPKAITWIILGILLLSLFPSLPLHISQLSLHLLLLLFFAAIYPEVRRISMRVPGAVIDWEKEVRELSDLIQFSTAQTQKIGRSADLHTALLEHSRRGNIARRLLALYQYLQENDESPDERTTLLEQLSRKFTEFN